MPKQDVAFELFYDGAWRDITADDDVFTAPIVIRRGQGDESPAPRPAQITAELANDDDRYRTSNPESPLYGKAGVNTPGRVSVGGTVRGVVEASSLACDQSQDFRRYPKRGRAWTEFEGGGLLQRIGQWTKPLKSAFRAYNEGLAHVTAYFPAEQARTTTVPVPTFVGPEGFAFSGGVTFDSQSYPSSSAPLMDLGERGGVNLYTNVVPNATSTTGWQHSWVQRLEPLTSDDTFMYSINTSGGGGSGDAFQIVLLPSTGQIQLQGSNSAVAPGFWLDVTKTTDAYDFTQWSLWTIDATYSGGTTTIFVNWTNADNTQSRFITGTFAHQPGTLDSAAVSASTELGDVPAGSTFGHFLFADVGSSGGTDLFSTDRIYAWTGYLGELTAWRFYRLLTAAGITNIVSDGWASSTPMGPQPVATLAGHLEEIARTEDGLIFDMRTQAAIYLLCLADRYNQTPALELSPTDLPGLPREVTDDLPVHNIVTVAQRDGGEHIARDDTSPMGTQPPPDGRGEYEQRVDVNVADEAGLPVLANWWLKRGTVNLPRYPQVTVNLAALGPAKVAEVEAVDVGHVITIAGFREYTIRLHVLGYTEVIGPTSRRITFVCAPDQQFAVGAYDDGIARYDLATSTMSAAAGPTTTTLTLGITADETWSSTSAYDLLTAGELVGVPAGGMGARTGSPGAYQQVITGAVRSKNAIRKTLPAGAAVHVATPGRWAR